MKSKKKYILLIALLVLALVCIISVVTNPWRKSCDRIKMDILEHMPLGTNFDDAIKFINNHDWEILNVYDSSGFRSATTNTIVGNSSIKFSPGSYRVFFVTDVVVFLGFDEQSQLIDIMVRKETDGL